MSNENLKHSLSAVMDNAADELELRRVLANADEEVMATWSRYQVASSVMRDEMIFPQLDIASAVSAAIAKEDVVVQPMAVSAQEKSNFWNHIGKFAVAASILTITLSTVYFFNDDDVATTTVNSYAQNTGTDVNGLNVASNDEKKTVEQKLTDLIEKHEKQSIIGVDDKK